MRYSGSLIPLSFSETQDKKGVFLIDFDRGMRRTITFLEAPTFRRLKTVEGDLEEVKQGLRRFAGKGDRLLTPWVEAVVETDGFVPQLDVQLNEFADGMELELLKIRIKRRDYPFPDARVEPEEDLQNLGAMDVFKKKCESYGVPAEEREELERTFLELQEWMKEKLT